MNTFKKVLRYTVAWWVTALVVLAILLTATLVATQNAFLSNTISTVMGGDRRVLVSGDPSKYQYFDKDIADFAQFAPTVGSFDKEGSRELSSAEKKERALEQANLLNEEIASEGFVLLKNEGGALPIDTKTAGNISVFGKNSVDLVYGGSGSGGGNNANNVSLYDSLENAGFTVNPTLKAFYEDDGQSGSGRPANPAIGAKVYGFATGETPRSSYTDAVKSSFADYKDAALIVISRIGGEGFDLPRTMVDSYGGTAVAGANAEDHYLELDNNEKALVEMVTSAGFDRVIMVINCSTSMELGFIEDNAGIDAAVWMGLPGGSGVNALGKLLNGTVNPSGRLVDTYARDFTKDPTYLNFGDNLSANGNEYLQGGSGSGYHYVEYEEGIYVGYRYYETKAFDELDFGNDAWYGENVVYPFGYGLSYTNFSWELTDYTDNTADLAKDASIELTVRVTNEGEVAGKDVVQLYYTAPYDMGGIEKAYVVLADYAKTPLIRPGDFAEVKLTVDVADMASYDYRDANRNSFKGYELEGGNYTLRVGQNAHECWNGSDLRVTYHVPSDGYTYPELAENRFDDMSDHFYSEEDGSSSLLTREDLRGKWVTAPTDAEREVSAEFIDSLTFRYDDANAPYYTEETFEQGVVPENGEYIQLYDLIRGDAESGYYVDYDDERWETVLNYLTTDEMINMIGSGNFNTAQIDRIGKPKTIDPDGPAGFTNFMGDPSVHDTCFYASECVIGATWNEALAHDMGVMVGIESLVGYTNGDGRTYSGWYAPAVNIHRSPFSGRNWEYYSEDPLLTGMMGANVVQGAQSKGVYTYVKHFVLNDQETDRDTGGLVTWADEQTFREIYLKPFEIIVKVGQTKALMSSFNRIGTVWAGGSYALLTEVLRGEWGFKGMVITDYSVSNAYMPPDQMIRAGGDLYLSQAYFPSSSGANFNSTHIAALRQAAKNILYVVAGSNAMNGYGEGVVYRYDMPYWQIALICVDVAAVAAFAVWGVFAMRKGLKRARDAENEPKGNV